MYIICYHIGDGAGYNPIVAENGLMVVLINA